MQHLGTKTLETKRIILRKITQNDYKAMYINWASLEECSKFFPWSTVTDIEIYRERVSSWISNYGNGLYFNWLMELTETGEVIGIINLHNVEEAEASAETSYILAPKYWNKGLMTEGLSRVLQYAFEELGLNRVRADVFRGNVASEKVLLKCGMQKEGIARAEYYKGGVYIDSIQYGVSRTAWSNFKEKVMQKKLYL